jgi:hypothetical protein
VIVELSMVNLFPTGVSEMNDIRMYATHGLVNICGDRGIITLTRVNIPIGNAGSI